MSLRPALWAILRRLAPEAALLLATLAVSLATGKGQAGTRVRARSLPAARACLPRWETAARQQVDCAERMPTFGDLRHLAVVHPQPAPQALVAMAIVVVVAVVEAAAAVVVVAWVVAFGQPPPQPPVPAPQPTSCRASRSGERGRQPPPSDPPRSDPVTALVFAPFCQVLRQPRAHLRVVPRGPVVRSGALCGECEHGMQSCVASARLR